VIPASFSRREFLQALGALAASGALASCNCFFRDAGRARFLLASPEGEIWVSALDGGGATRARTRMRNSHGFVALPGGRILVLDKLGGRAAVVSARDGHLERELDATVGRQFYGHGAWAPSLQRVLTVEANANHEGFLVLRDPATLEPRAERPTHGRSPHDLLLLGDRYAICNSESSHGGRSTVTFCELATGKLLYEAVAPEDDLLFGHLGPGAKDGEAVASTQAFRRNGEKKDPRPSPTFLVRQGSAPAVLDCGTDLPRSLSGFSVASNGSVAAVSHGPSRTVAFYDVRAGTLIRFLELPGAGWPSAVSALPDGDFAIGAVKGEFWRVRAPEFARTEPLLHGIRSEHSFVWVPA
jgi:hypothetical protein